jgi:cysteine desulfurase / selenocysteine lyase
MHYMDYAATSAVRPDTVCDAVAAFLRGCGASPGRGGYVRSVESGRIVFRCRRALTRLLGLPGDPGRMAMMFNATHALNTALAGILRSGDVVVVSDYDHNAVLRPVHRLASTRGVVVRRLPGDPSGAVDLEEARRLLQGARLLVVNHVSNVLGTVLPLRALARLAHEAGALVLVDAAQSAGHIPVSLADDGADLVAVTGHKGLLGPQGTGGLWVREGVEVDPLLCGGTGGNSSLREMPAAMPDHLEAGTPNAAGIAGLLAGVEHVQGEGVAMLHAREAALKDRLREGLGAIRGVRVLSPRAPEGAAVVTVVADRVDPATLAKRLDDEFGVQTRPGLHCAPEVHRILGTQDSGALRLSLGWASSEADVDRALEGVRAIAGAVSVPVNS